MTVELPTAVHEAPFDYLKKAFEKVLDNIPCDEDNVLMCLHMNREVFVAGSLLVPDMLMSLMAIQGGTFKAPWYLLVRECAFSEQKSHVVDKLKKYVWGFPHLMVVVMVVIDKVCSYKSPTRDSDAGEFFHNSKKVLSLDEFLSLHPTSEEPLHLNAPITVKGHTWCHISSVDYYVWVRQPGKSPINLDSTDAAHMAHGVSPMLCHSSVVDTNQAT